MTLYVIRPSIIMFNDDFTFDYGLLPQYFPAGDNNTATEWVIHPSPNTQLGDVYFTHDAAMGIWGQYSELGPYEGPGTDAPTPGMPVTAVTAHAIVSADAGADLNWFTNYSDGFVSDHVTASGVISYTHLQLNLPLEHLGGLIFDYDRNQYVLDNTSYANLSITAQGSAEWLMWWSIADEIAPDHGLKEIPYLSATPDDVNLDSIWNHAFEITDQGQVYSLTFEPNNYPASGGRPDPIPAQYVRYTMWLIREGDIPGDHVVDLPVINVRNWQSLPDIYGETVTLNTNGLDPGLYRFVVTLQASPSTIPTPTYDDPDSYSTARIYAERKNEVRLHEWWVEILSPGISQTPRELRRRFTGGVTHSA